MLTVKHKAPLGKLVREFREVFSETIWPTRCAICDTPGKLLCEKCEQKLLFIDMLEACPTCGAPFGKTLCTECCDTTLSLHGRTEFPLDSMAHVLVIDEDAKRIVTTFKDHDEIRLAYLIARFMHRYISLTWLNHSPTLTYIPASKVAYTRRGFDHCEMIAQCLSSMSGLTLTPLFERPTHIDQRKLTRRNRVQNQSGSLVLKKLENTPECVLVIDDICTTGSTMYNAADALREGGVKKIFGLTFGHVID